MELVRLLSPIKIPNNLIPNILDIKIAQFYFAPLGGTIGATDFPPGIHFGFLFFSFLTLCLLIRTSSLHF